MRGKLTQGSARKQCSSLLLHCHLHLDPFFISPVKKSMLLTLSF